MHKVNTSFTPPALTWTHQHAQHDGAPRPLCFIKRWKAGPYTQLSAVSSKNSSTETVYGYICQLHRERQISFRFSPVPTHLRLICCGSEACCTGQGQDGSFNRSLCLSACSHLRTQSSGHKRMHGLVVLFPFTDQYLLQNALNYGTRERRDRAENPTREKQNKMRNIYDFKTGNCVHGGLFSHPGPDGILCSCPFTYKKRFLEATWSFVIGRSSDSRPNSETCTRKQ